MGPKTDLFTLSTEEGHNRKKLVVVGFTVQSGRDTPTIIILANSVNDKKTLGTNLT